MAAVIVTVSSITCKRVITATVHAWLKVRAQSTKYEKHSTWWGIKSLRCGWVASAVTNSIGLLAYCRLLLNSYN